MFKVYNVIYLRWSSCTVRSISGVPAVSYVYFRCSRCPLFQRFYLYSLFCFRCSIITVCTFSDVQVARSILFRSINWTQCIFLALAEQVAFFGCISWTVLTFFEWINWTMHTFWMYQRNGVLFFGWNEQEYKEKKGDKKTWALSDTFWMYGWTVCSFLEVTTEQCSWEGWLPHTNYPISSRDMAGAEQPVCRRVLQRLWTFP